MKRIAYALLLATFIMMSGCGGEVSVSSTIMVPVLVPPEIMDLQFTQDRSQRIVAGSFRFSAPDNDLDTMTVVVFDSAGREVSRSVTGLGSFRGFSAGILYFSVDYISYLPDNYSFTVYVTDQAGFPSNGLYSSFFVP